LRLVRVRVAPDNDRVTARFLELFAPSYALYRGAFGCTSVPDGHFEAAANAVPFDPPAKVQANDAFWHEGEGTGDRPD
ncbi:6-aminohexanoate hydrolase, partial [Rhizobium ruizarguesonis]